MLPVTWNFVTLKNVSRCEFMFIINLEDVKSIILYLRAQIHSAIRIWKMPNPVTSQISNMVKHVSKVDVPSPEASNPRKAFL
jgi:hypothetical protein